MAEERNPLDAASDDTAEIKQEIERTRVEMSETLNEIQDRLRPDHLLQQARDEVSQAAAGKVKDIMSSAGETASTMVWRARGAGDYLADYAKAHPIRIAATVGAVAWWMLRGRNDDEEWYGEADTSWDDAEALSYDDRRSLRNRVGDYAASAKQTVGGYASSAREKAGEYASSARQAVGEYASTAREVAGGYAESARSNARHASERVRSTASSTSNSVDGFVRDNPLAAGAIALAVGVAIGLAVPPTEVENRAMGEARDQAMQQARRAAATIKTNVAKKVETAAENFVGENIAAIKSTEPLGRA